MVVPFDAATEATAQHCDIQTPPHDFSVDPHMAIYFACHTRITDQKQLSIVYAYEFERAPIPSAPGPSIPTRWPTA
jgi:hypothetical protein